jgi:hypothetical protein
VNQIVGRLGDFLEVGRKGAGILDEMAQGTLDRLVMNFLP